MSGFDLEYLGENGHIRPEEAQSFHTLMMKKHGVTDPEEVAADWNRRDPASPWGSGKVGRYVRELTGLVCEFMSEQIAAAGGPSVTVSSLPTPEEIKADPDRILEIHNVCPKCGDSGLEALTWQSIGSDAVTVGCWACGWMIYPPGHPDAKHDSPPKK